MKFLKLILMFCLIIFSADNIIGCQPVFQRHTKYFRKAKAVFIGKVIEVGRNNNKDADRLTTNRIKFDVEKSWKGSKSQITVVADNDLYPCNNVEFRVGERYLIYAFNWEKELYVPTYIGNRSRILARENDQNKKELEELNDFWFRFKSHLIFF